MNVKKISIYTDGACSGNPGPGGWASIFCFPEGIKTISGGERNTTNNRMELTAIINTLVLINNMLKKNENLYFTIYSDSAYCVSSINNGWIISWRLNDWKTKANDEVKNKDLWFTFYKIWTKVRSNVKFEKVAGHSGDAMNEKADAIAREEVQKLK